MKKNSLFYMLSVLMVVIACGTKQQEPSQEEEIPIASYEAKGDSMLYGLACDGCNDSVLVFLSDKGGDPISMNMLNAMRSHRVFGRPEVGDRMAVIVSPEDSTKVLVAVDMDMLRGTWVYDQLPHRKDPGRAVNVDSIRRTLDEAEVRRIDSLFASMMVPREYGYTLKRDYSEDVDASESPDSRIEDFLHLGFVRYVLLQNEVIHAQLDELLFHFRSIARVGSVVAVGPVLVSPRIVVLARHLLVSQNHLRALAGEGEGGRCADSLRVVRARDNRDLVFQPVIHHHDLRAPRHLQAHILRHGRGCDGGGSFTMNLFAVRRSSHER